MSYEQNVSPWTADQRNWWPKVMWPWPWSHDLKIAFCVVHERCRNKSCRLWREDCVCKIWRSFDLDLGQKRSFFEFSMLQESCRNKTCWYWRPKPFSEISRSCDLDHGHKQRKTAFAVLQRCCRNKSCFYWLAEPFSEISRSCDLEHGHFEVMWPWAWSETVRNNVVSHAHRLTKPKETKAEV